MFFPAHFGCSAPSLQHYAWPVHSTAGVVSNAAQTQWQQHMNVTTLHSLRRPNTLPAQNIQCLLSFYDMISSGLHFTHYPWFYSLLMSLWDLIAISGPLALHGVLLVFRCLFLWHLFNDSIYSIHTNLHRSPTYSLQSIEKSRSRSVHFHSLHTL